MSFNQAIGVVSPSIVGINTSGGQQQSASGIIVHHFGYILTNYHVVKGAKDIVVTINFDQLIKSYSGQVFDSREVLDLAIIKVKPTGKETFTPAPLGDSDRVYIGQWVVAIGNPFGLTQSASSGMVSNADRTLTAGDKVFDGLIQTDASINPGSSFSGISFAIPINQAKNAFPDLIEIVQSPLAKLNTRANMGRPGTSVPVGMNLQMMASNRTARPGCWLGIHAYPANNMLAKEMNFPTQHGVLVNHVFIDSPASKVGLMKGDVIFRVDSKRIKDENMLWSLLAGKKVGDKVKIAVLRNGNKKNFVATLQPAVPDVSGLFSNTPQELIPLTAELATEYQIPQGESGVLVDEVTLEAAESGILAGDMVQSVGGFPTPDLKAFFRATQRDRVREAKRAQVGISRRGSKMTFVMTTRNTNMLGFAQMEAAQPIQPGALRPHRYMGSCTNCHVFMKTGGQLATDAGDILPSPPPIARNAMARHRYRGQCATCHTIR
jgi:serine protease Do